MDRVMTLQRGSTWSPVPVAAWTYRHGDTCRNFREAVEFHEPTLEVWAWLAGAVSTCVPGIGAAVGGEIVGASRTGLRGEYVPGMILIALAGNRNPIETAYHEAFHSVWDSHFLEEIEECTPLSDHADKLRMKFGADYDMMGDGEAEALSFGLWAVGRPLAPPPADVLTIWQAIKCGDIATRKD